MQDTLALRETTLHYSGPDEPQLLARLLNSIHEMQVAEPDKYLNLRAIKVSTFPRNQASIHLRCCALEATLKELRESWSKMPELKVQVMSDIEPAASDESYEMAKQFDPKPLRFCAEGRDRQRVALEFAIVVAKHGGDLMHLDLWTESHDTKDGVLKFYLESKIRYLTHNGPKALIEALRVFKSKFESATFDNGFWPSPFSDGR